MIFWLIAALAATPTELAEAAPAAEQTLDRCAEQGCEAQEGAHAAWVLALHGYVSEGVADGLLAATVRDLDAELFTGLPEVIQRSATAPMLWVGAAPEPDVTVEIANLQDVEHKPKVARCELEIEVLDGAGVPVATANVRFPDEGENHRVNILNGRVFASVLYLPSGRERIFQKDDDVAFDVMAPGYAYTRVQVNLSKKRRNKITVVLAAWTPTLSANPTSAERLAIEGWTRWADEEALFVQTYDQAAAARLRRARRQAASLARDWMDAGGGDDAHQICLMTGSLLLCGDP